MGKSILFSIVGVCSSFFFSAYSAFEGEDFNPLFPASFFRESTKVQEKLKRAVIKNVMDGIERNRITDDFFNSEIHSWSDEQGRTLMHYAAQKNRLVICVIFYVFGADLNAVDNNGNTPLIDAVLAYEEEEASLVTFFHKVQLPASIIKRIKKILENVDLHYVMRDFSLHVPLCEHVDDIIKFLLLYSTSVAHINNDGFSAYDFFAVDGLRSLLEHFFFVRDMKKVNEVALELIQRRKDDELDERLSKRKIVREETIMITRKVDRSKSM